MEEKIANTIAQVKKKQKKKKKMPERGIEKKRTEKIKIEKKSVEINNRIKWQNRSARYV